MIVHGDKLPWHPKSNEVWIPIAIFSWKLFQLVHCAHRMDQPSIESEIKLEGDMPALRGAFETLTRDRPIDSRELSNDYFDTPDSRLESRGFALRLRNCDERGLELTLKRGSRGSDRNFVTRDEWTSRIREEVIDLALLPDDAPHEELGDIDSRALSVKFSTKFRRTCSSILANQSNVEVALDEGEISAGNKTSPISELELELQSGSLNDLLELSRTVILEESLSLSAESKASRGARLAQDTLIPPSEKAEPILLTTPDSVSTALSKIAATTATHLLVNRKPASQGDNPEGVHQTRVALRRFRSALLMFRDFLSPEGLRLAEFAREMLRELGPARDIDVFVLETLALVTGAHPAEDGIELLRGKAEIRRHKEQEKVRQSLARQSFDLFILDLMLASASHWLTPQDLEVELLPTLSGLLKNRLRKVLKAGTHFAQMPSAERHEVRLALKKLRYACDFSRGIFPSSTTRKYLRRLSALQDEMGILNDATVAGRLAQDLAGTDPASGNGAAFVRGWYCNRLHTSELRVVKMWQQFVNARPFWQDH